MHQRLRPHAPRAQLGAAGHDAAAVWAAVQRVVALSLAAMQPPVAHSYTTAFVTGGPAAVRSGAARRPSAWPWA